MDIVCFNDTELLDNYIMTRKKLAALLGKMLPNKCSFEY